MSKYERVYFRIRAARPTLSKLGEPVSPCFSSMSAAHIQYSRVSVIAINGQREPGVSRFQVRPLAFAARTVLLVQVFIRAFDLQQLCNET